MVVYHLVTKAEEDKRRDLGMSILGEDYQFTRKAEEVASSPKTLFDKIEKYCYILHDKDTKEDGTSKHAHYHLFLQFSQQVDFSYPPNHPTIDKANRLCGLNCRGG